MTHHCPICEHFQTRVQEKSKRAKIALVEDVIFGSLTLVLVLSLIFMGN